MPRAAAAGFVALAVAIGMVAWRIAEPSRLYVEADNTALLAGIATSAAAQANALTPSPTPYRSPTPTRTPHPPASPTATALPVYGAAVAGTLGLYTFAPPAAGLTPTVIDWPACADLARTPTPMPFKRTCEVR